MENIREIKDEDQLNDLKKEIKELGEHKSKKFVLNFIKEGQINFSLNLIKSFLTDINYSDLEKHFFCLDINYLSEDGVFLDTEENKMLKEIEKFLTNKNIPFKVGQKNFLYKYSLDDQIKSSQILEDIVNDINKLTLLNGNKKEKLSPFEKFMFVYEIVSGFVYNEGGDYAHQTTSNWAPVLLGGKIVCGGYSSLMKAICDRVSTRDEITIYEQGLDVFNENLGYIGGHSNILVKLKDEKYNIDGIFYADPCWDSAKSENKYGGAKYCLLTANEVARQKSLKVLFHVSNPLNTYLLLSNPSYKKTLENLCKKYLNNDEKIYQDINHVLSLGCFDLMRQNLLTLNEMVLNPDSPQKYSRFLQLYYKLWEETGLLSTECIGEISDNKRDLKEKIIKNEIDKRNKEECLFDFYCAKHPEIQTYFCPNDIAFFRSEPLIDVTLDLINRRGFNAFDEEKHIVLLCKLMSLKKHEYEQFFKEKELNQEHLCLRDYIKNFANENYYIPNLKRLKNNLEKLILDDNDLYLKSLENTYNLAFNVPSINNQAFKAVFGKIGEIYDLKDQNLDDFVERKMQDVSQREAQSLQEIESIHKI